MTWPGINNHSFGPRGVDKRLFLFLEIKKQDQGRSVEAAQVPMSDTFQVEKQLVTTVCLSVCLPRSIKERLLGGTAFVTVFWTDVEGTGSHIPFHQQNG